LRQYNSSLLYSTYRSNFCYILFLFDIFIFLFHYFSHREYTSNTEEPNETEESDTNMSRRMIVPPEHMSQHQYVPQSPAHSFNYARQQQPTPQKKHIQHDTDV